MFDSFQQMNPSEPDKYDYVDLRCRKQANMFIQGSYTYDPSKFHEFP